MFKKIIFITLAFSPLLFSIFIGYPVVSNKEFLQKVKTRPQVSVSKRCFAVGDFGEFKGCWKTSDRINGSGLTSEVLRKTSSISPFFALFITCGMVMFIILGVSVLIF